MTIKSWASLGATTVFCAVVALWAGGTASAQDAPPPAPQATAAAPAAGGNATRLVNQIEMLKQGNRQLLGQVEQLQHQLQQLKEINKEQYVALNTRIQRLEQGQAAPAAADSSADEQPSASASDHAAPTPATTGSSEASASAGKAGSAPASASTSLTGNPDAQKAYDTAFNALRAGDFVTSSRGFRAFVQQYPHDTLTPNAWYWLGESYYVTQNYTQAMAAFDKVVQGFPDSRKAPGALLKKGYCQYALKETDAATATLGQVVARYPNDPVAKLAKQRLADIHLQQQLH